MSFKIVFMGSPNFAVPSLRAIASHTVGVVTQPDKPAGRGRSNTPCPVKVAALQLGLPVVQPERLPHAIEQLQSWQPDLIVVAAFGKLLRPAVLHLPRLGCVNVHASLLPRHRGAAPVAAAILAGDEMAGVTLMQMDEGLDTGPMLAKLSTPVAPDETASQLTARLAQLGAQLLAESLPGLITAQLQPVPQDERLATYAPQLNKADGLLTFSNGATAAELSRRVRAMSDWPGAFVRYQDQPLKIIRAHAVEGAAPAGVVIKHRSLPAIGTAHGVLALDDVQPAGKKPMPAASFLNGNPSFIGAQFP